MNGTNLNSGQASAARAIRKFLRDPSTVGTVFTLTGGPGTGKTYMLHEVLKDYNRDNIQAVTISHAAKNVLQDALGSSYTVRTISSLLGLSPNILEDGSFKFAVSNKNREKASSMLRNGVLIIDEVSQIADELYKELISQARDRQVRIIAVGDPYQLPPVEQETDSKFFDEIHATLTESMRFKGPIAELADIYKGQIDHINNESGFDKWALNTFTDRIDKYEEETGYSFTKNLDSIVKSAAKDIRENPSDPSYARVLAFRNEAVAEVNKRIRVELYGDNLQQFEDGEILISNGGFGVDLPRHKVDSSGNMIPDGFRRENLLYNGQIVKVKGYSLFDGPEGVPCKALDLYYTGKMFSHPIIVVDSSYEAQQKFKMIKDKKFLSAKNAEQPYAKKTAWAAYYKFLQSFAVFDYAYAVNLYKAQGQTLTNVYVCEGEVMDVKPLTWKQKFQALYVAMTRAKEKLFIYNKDF